ncbi:unnamed protein product [Pieris brassicae]|uniref:Uncharacterized protein n=1 Tax=Pieris brassicae TaxID=7116 RepID=A0A9P0T2U3_PIEBR|nr:unnamed protein product [Pieris brassicae]
MNRFYYAEYVSITEKRGGNHKERKYAAQKQSVDNFIQKLKCVESYYCRKTKTAERRYLPSELNIYKLCKMFMESDDANTSVNGSHFRRIFNAHYNLGFGTPKTGVCSKCLELNEKIMIETDPNKKNELIIEKRVHSGFFRKIKGRRRWLEDHIF